MPQPTVNDWLRNAGGNRSEFYAPLLDALFRLRPQDVGSILWPILDFRGTKIIVSCTDRSHLENVLKLSLCLADLAIIVPAPLWIDCCSAAPVEFNSDSIEPGNCANAACRS